MILTLDDVREVLEQEYYRDNINFLFERLFSDFRKSNVLIDIPSKFKEIRQIGESQSIDIKIYEVKLTKDIEQQRVGITKEMFRILKSLNEYNAVAVFVNEDENNYRLSLLTTSFATDDGKIKKEYSNPHRYSYYLGKGTKTKTVYDVLYSQSCVKTLDELKERFSIDIVNKQFYSKVALSFTKLVGGTSGKMSYKKQLGFSQNVPVNKYSEFGVRLLGRLIFCWFLKEKKSDKGVPLVPEILFDNDFIDGCSNYYNEILQTLFFESLNTPWEKRNESVNNEYFKSIPYLNGGLFSPQHDDFYDGLGSQNVHIPNSWFKELFEILRQYNFTVDESTSYDVELSIDPEMLGRIFENLLADINPETGESARKSTGSFYTPRDIVDFMVNTSLYEHLVNTTGIDATKVESLIQFGINDDIQLTLEEKTKIVDSLYSIKILDPACGSGAFPMGLLQKIVYILQEADPDNILWLDKIEKDQTIDEETKKQIQWSSIDYTRKLLVIKNSIFGVDIQPIAAEISKLRCFLSIVIEEKIDDKSPNRGIRPLPNLDFNFAIGNTLVPLEDEDNEISLFDDYELIEELNDIRKQWFTADFNLREKLKEQIASLQSRMVLNISGYQNLESQKYNRLSKWSPSSNDENEWFDSGWMFGVDKFDIVIGNPPYIHFETHKDLSKFYSKFNYKTYVPKGDIYCLFYEKGMSLLKQDGILTFITSNSWMRAEYGSSLREFLAKQNPILLVDFGGKRIFETATVDVNVLVCQNKGNCKKTNACTAGSECKNDLIDFIKKESILSSFTTNDLWIIAPDYVFSLKDKITSLGTPLEPKIWGIDICYGVKTGYNPAFIIDEMEMDRIIENDPKSAELIHPVLRGRDIKKYGINYAHLYVIATFPNRKIDIDKYPGIKNFLLGFGKERLDQTGKTFINDRGEKEKSRSNTGNKWFELQCNMANWDQLEKPKLVYPETTKTADFYYDDGRYYVDKTCFYIYGDERVLKYILATLSSDLFQFAFPKIFSSTKLSGEGYQYNEQALRKVPVRSILSIKEDTFEKIISLVDKQLEYVKLHGSESAEIKKELNDIFYAIYGISDYEIAKINEYVLSLE